MVIFIKFKKYIVVALAVLCVVVSSCVSAFALDDKYSSVDVFQADYVKSCLESDSTFKKYSVKSKYYFVSCSIGGSDDIPRYFLNVKFFDDNKFWNDTSGLGMHCNDILNYEYDKSLNSFVNTDVVEGSNRVLNNFSTSFSDVIYSTVDIINSADGSVFFQRPLTLLERLLNPVQEQVGEKVVADSLILTICGISLIALLVGCSLVPKVLHKFRV
ncbi:hypothetical protein H8R91_02630 [Ruminococcus sp. NSJ-71]|uniref:TPM domain-containing protein n=1 Tax=Ruminococcus intestinalis TaxID=2763066 RepID=A0ABR7HIV6_9FIRM|nr:hypothetical protein [Ruminococcus intestinalis]MBC5727431.1 hypothetical protein [Ruminococcus intestinalis]MBC5727443.1 hypothetical protein [Ruminococcus intestinalis]